MLIGIYVMSSFYLPVLIYNIKKLNELSKKNYGYKGFLKITYWNALLLILNRLLCNIFFIIESKKNESHKYSNLNLVINNFVTFLHKLLNIFPLFSLLTLVCGCTYNW
jgi:hypothetical protein